MGGVLTESVKKALAVAVEWSRPVPLSNPVVPVSLELEREHRRRLSLGIKPAVK